MGEGQPSPIFGAMQKFHCATKEEMMFYHKLEEANVIEWNGQLDHDVAVIAEQNHFFRNYHRQWGHRPGVNSGNGQLEARIPAKLHYMMLEKDPHYIEDDRAWDHFTDLFPALKVMPR